MGGSNNADRLIGESCVGKSTVAAALKEKLNAAA